MTVRNLENGCLNDGVKKVPQYILRTTELETTFLLCATFLCLRKDIFILLPQFKRILTNNVLHIWNCYTEEILSYLSSTSDNENCHLFI